MSENNNTNPEEILNGEEKIIVRIEISEASAEKVLNQFHAPFPAIADLNEIHLLIRRNKVSDWKED